MKTYQVKYMYFKIGNKAEYGYVIVQTESEDEQEIMRIASEKARSETGKEVKLMEAKEI